VRGLKIKVRIGGKDNRRGDLSSDCERKTSDGNTPKNKGYIVFSGPGHFVGHLVR